LDNNLYKPAIGHQYMILPSFLIVQNVVGSHQNLKCLKYKINDTKIGYQWTNS